MTQDTSQYLYDTSKYESVPCTVDRIATQTPGKPFISISLDDNVRKGYRDISFSVFARAVNRCSWWLKQELGQSQSFEPLSYCGPQDLRYLILILASVKTGHNVRSTRENFSIPTNADNLIRFCFALLLPRPKTTFHCCKQRTARCFCILQILYHWLNQSCGTERWTHLSCLRWMTG